MLAHVDWNGLNFKNESPEDVMFELVAFKNGVEKRTRITTWDDPSWLDEAEILYGDLMKFGLNPE